MANPGLFDKPFVNSELRAITNTNETTTDHQKHTMERLDEKLWQFRYGNRFIRHQHSTAININNHDFGLETAEQSRD